MKKVTIIILLFFCLSTNAQLNIGSKGGISISNLEDNNNQSKYYTSNQGIYLYGGMFINFQLSKLLSLQPELNFSQQGVQRKGMQRVPFGAINEINLPPGINLYADSKSTVILNYLEIPILAKFTLGHKLKYFACFGPHISFLMQAKTTTKGNSLLYIDASGSNVLMQKDSPLPPVLLNSTISSKKSIKTVNAGVQAGAGLQYPVGRGNIFVEYRTIIGLTNIHTNSRIDGKSETGSLAVAVGYVIKIK